MRRGRDHPRIHGEHLSLLTSARDAFGITPAYTGNTSAKAKKRLTIKDHPRIHGEHSANLVLGMSSLGSPPHTRGTLFTQIDWAITSRITPAYTGNTRAGKDDVIVIKDHPRIHGEHTKRSLIYRHF